MSNATAIQDPRVGTVVQDRYRILQRLAAGGMGVVYRGERVGLGRKVAVKFLHPWVAEDASFKLRFELEAQVMGRLNHPTCVSVIDWGIDGDAPFLVMDHVEGTTLRLVLREGRLAPRRAVELMRQVLTGLAHAHAQGVVHRDLKPDNVMLTELEGLGELVRILDFGLAKLKDAASGLSMGMVLGTPNYMPPEQVRAEAVDERSDLYAVGAVLFEVLTGAAPFANGAASEIMRRQLHETPPRLSAAVPGAGFSEALESVVARALAKSPDARFQTATEFIKALELTPEASAEASEAAWRSPEPGARAVPGAREAEVPAGSASGAVIDRNAREDEVLLAPTHVSLAAGDAPLQSQRTDGSTADAVGGPDAGKAREAFEVSGAGKGASDGPGTVGADADAPRTRSMRKTGQAVPESSPGGAGRAVGDAASAVASPVSGRVGAQRPLAVRLIAGAVGIGLLGAGVGLVRSGQEVAVDRPAATTSGTTRTPSAGKDDVRQASPVSTPAAALAPEDAKPDDAATRGAADPNDGDEALDAIARFAKAGQRDRALRGLATYRKAHPGSAAAARLEGQVNFDHLRWDDGLEAYGDALRLDPGLREDRELIADLIGCLVSDQAHRRCGRFLVQQVGEPARPQLEEAARSFRYANVQRRAKRLLQAGGLRAR